MVVRVEYDYVNARIKGMKSRLLAPSVFETLILKPDVESIIAELENTPYKNEIEKATVQYSGIQCIEVALRKDFTNAFRKILSFVKGGESEVYINILLSRWDIQNIKTILRGKNIHMTSAEIIECLVPAGQLDDSTLIELIKQPDVKAVIDLLATWGIEYAKPLTRNFKEYSEKRDLTILEYAIDKFYYENALDKLGEDSYDDRIILDMITTEIDVTNIKNVLKMMRDKIGIEEAEPFLIKGGITLDIEKLLSMLKSGTLEGAIKALEATPYKFLSELPADAFKTEKVSVFEKALEKYLIKREISRFLGDPLSIAVAVGYVWAKYNEITNIRIIARCKTADITEKEIREELIYV
ncbi:MAG: ATP synthase A1 subunit C [Methanoregula sp.]|jgi:V/A-type H+-transporting ATPase subunit C|nr:ATP synthase A1 subunit C [Methanoregula sp.]